MCHCNLEEGSEIFHSAVLNCQPVSWEILKSNRLPHRNSWHRDKYQTHAIAEGNNKCWCVCDAKYNDCFPVSACCIPVHAVYRGQTPMPHRHATIMHLMPGLRCESCCSTRSRQSAAHLTARLSRQPPSKRWHRCLTFPRKRTRKEESVSNL